RPIELRANDLRARESRAHRDHRQRVPRDSSHDLLRLAIVIRRRVTCASVGSNSRTRQHLECFPRRGTRSLTRKAKPDEKHPKPPRTPAPGSAHRDPRVTEQRNPRTADIDLASPVEIVDLISAEDRGVADAVYTQRDAIGRAIEEAEATF